MSMNYFFKAFTQQQIDAMAADNALIDQNIFEEENFAHSTDVENAWDVLQTVLDGAGFHAGDFIDDTLSNGGFIVSSDEVKTEAERLAQWTRENVAEAVRNLDASADLYRQDIYQDDEDALLEEFDNLVAFYTTAAAEGLGVVHYAA